MAKVSYETLSANIDDDGGVYLTTMEVLRDVHGAGRLGVNVRDAISSRLSGQGIGHLPDVLPTYQHEPVRLYRLGSPIAAVIDAVLWPSEGGDQVLRQTVGSESQEVLKKIRQLVCE